MQLVHTGMLVTSLKHAEDFFGNLLGLSFSREYDVPPDLMTELFGVTRGFHARVYDLGDHKIEVFISEVVTAEGSEKKTGTGPGRESGRRQGENECNPVPIERGTGLVTGKSGNLANGSVNHICLQVDDRENLIERALDLGFSVYERQREGKPNLVFLFDRDRNPYEIVE